MGVAVVQHRSTFATSVTNVALAFASNNTASNLLCYLNGAGLAGTISACTDSNSNTIANATSEPGNSGTGSGAARADYVASCNAGANTVTGHTSTADDIHLHIWEISGCVTSSPLRDSGTVTSSATGSVSTAGSSSLSGDAVVGFFMDNPANDALTAGSGYSPSELTSDSSGGDAALSEFKAATAGGTQTATCSGNGTNVLGQIIVVFKQGAAGATPVAVDDTDVQQQRFVNSTRMESQHQQELQDTFAIPPQQPPFAFEDDGQHMRWSDWRALQYEEVDIHRALPPIPPFSIEDDAERQKNVNWSAIQYDDTDTHRALPPTPPFAIVDEISERPLPGVTPFVEEDQPGKPIVVAPAPNIGLDDIEAHIKAFDRVATYYEDDVFNTALAPPLAQQDEISERTFNWSAPAIEDDWRALPPAPPTVQQEEISERWAGTSAVQFEEDQPLVPIVTSLPPPSIEDDMGQRWSATTMPAIEDDWNASTPRPPFAFEDDLKTFSSDARFWTIEEDFPGKPPLPPVILTASDDEASQVYVDWNLGYARFGAAMDDYDSHLLPSALTGPFVLIAALRHATYSALVAFGGMKTYSALQANVGMKTYSQLQAAGGMKFLDGGA